MCQHIANTEMCVLLAEKFENNIQAIGEPQMCSFIIFFFSLSTSFKFFSSTN